MRHDPFPCADRVGRLRSGFPETDALLILGEKNIRYLTGFTGGDGALMAGPDWLTLLVDGRYVTQARAEARGAEIFEFRKRADGIVAVARRHGVGSIGFESSVLLGGGVPEAEGVASGGVVSAPFRGISNSSGPSRMRRRSTGSGRRRGSPGRPWQRSGR